MIVNQQHPLLKTKQVLGLPLHLTDNYAEWALEQIGDRHGLHVITLNAEMAMQAQQNAELAEVIHNADLVVPDGSGIVLYFWLRGQRIHALPPFDRLHHPNRVTHLTNHRIHFLGRRFCSFLCGMQR